MRFSHRDEFASGEDEPDPHRADLRDGDLRDTWFGAVNTGDPDNAFTDLTGVVWSPGGPREATFGQVLGTPT